MRTDLPAVADLRGIVTQSGFCVKKLSMRVGITVRTLERRFSTQLRTTPKAWMMQERMNSAPSLLAEGLPNKQVAAALNYTSEANFCRDFKRHFGIPPQQFARAQVDQERSVAS